MSRRSRRRQQKSTNQQFKRSQAFQTHLSQLNDMLSQYQLIIQDVYADGNCLFRSVADQLDGNDSTHFYYRLIACEELSAKKMFYQDFIEEKIDDYIQDMRKDGTWGDHLVLQALCEALNINIAVHSLDGVFVVGDSKYSNSTIEKKSSFHRFFLKIICQLQLLQTLYIKLAFNCRKKKFSVRRIIHLAYMKGELFPEHYTSIRRKGNSLKCNQN